MQSARQTLLLLLRNIYNAIEQIPPGAGALPLPEAVRQKVKEHVLAIDRNVLQFYPPNPLPVFDTNILVADIHSSFQRMTCNIFMLTTPGARLPLHNHPQIDGFIRPLTGKLLVSSFSWLDADEERHLMEQKTPHEAMTMRPARFDGTRIIQAEDPEVVTLSHQQGNVHSLEAVEPASSFFDVLIPDYGNRSCIYYQWPDNPVPGQVYFLKTIPIFPIMFGIPFETVSLNNILNIY